MLTIKNNENKTQIRIKNMTKINMRGETAQGKEKWAFRQ